MPGARSLFLPPNIAGVCNCQGEINQVLLTIVTLPLRSGFKRGCLAPRESVARLSSAEAEYSALVKGVAEGLFVHSIMRFLRKEVELETEMFYF